MLHIGVGAFHRAHQAVYTEEAMAAAGGDWGIVAVAPRSADLVAQLRAQDHLYSVTSRSGDSSRTRVVGALTGTRHLPTEADDVLRLFADPAIKVVTLTVTEKAYRLDPATGTLRMDEEVRADLAAQRAPVTIPGLLVRGLRARAAAGSPPIAIVCCDNLPGNGAGSVGWSSSPPTAASVIGSPIPARWWTASFRPAHHPRCSVPRPHSGSATSRPSTPKPIGSGC
ncbi:hypothetical protein NKG94_50440 [Micromonospora sp. M12]